MEMESLQTDLERVRMCLAEAGYDPTYAFIGPQKAPRDGALCVHVSNAVPQSVIFRAYQISGALRRCPACWWSDRGCTPDDHDDDCTMDGWDR